ncbi:MFS transporter [Dankookia rubra]|uniref:MFS transporter n=1 Tax=Dankookia rubra TaxID=1442381 RepID=A0A4R5QEA7_9PROT|nr:MFS transporter [Dankookia rubra]TDH60999.1 MFS transporter [Dankookia rubra]
MDTKWKQPCVPIVPPRRVSKQGSKQEQSIDDGEAQSVGWFMLVYSASPAPDVVGTGRLSDSAIVGRRDFTRPDWRLRTILAVYSYQGLVAGFGLTALPNHLAAIGASAGAIGALMAMIGLPWALQPLWGPVVDGFGRFRMGRRRFWIVLAQAAALGCLGLLPLAGDGLGAMPWLGAILMVHSACAALLDTAMDAMIIDRTPADRLGQATALTRTGFVAGTALGATTFAWAIPAIGLPGTAGLLLLLAASLAWVPLTVLELPGDDLLSLRQRPFIGAQVAEPSRVRLLRLLWRLFSMMRQPAALALITLCVVEEFATSVFGVRLAVEMIQVGGWDPAALSRLQGGLAILGGTLGALSIGWWSDRVGPYRTLVVLFWVCAAAYGGSALLLLAPPTGSAAALAMALTSIVPALVFVALAPAVMQASRGPAAATRFALFMAALNLGSALGAAASGPIGAVLRPWQTVLGSAAIFAVCAMVSTRPERLFVQSKNS